MIREIIVTTEDEDGTTHIAPMGIREEAGHYIIAPFKPSITLENILRSQTAIINYSDDVRIFAGCLTDHRDWQLVDAEKINGRRLAVALGHVELQLAKFEDDAVRPRCYCSVVHNAVHKSFLGFNRAQAAVIEATILVSRLSLLPPEKITSEVAYLSIAIEKTAGPDERLAWEWLLDKIKQFQQSEQQGE